MQHGLMAIDATMPQGAVMRWSLIDASDSSIIPGFLEGSNVKITDELVRMLKYQQAYSGNSRLLQTEIDITRRLIEG